MIKIRLGTYGILALMASMLTANAGGLSFPVSAIPESLKLNADAVIRGHYIEKEITENGYTHTEYYVVTIFNKNAQELGYFMESSDKLSTISDYHLNIYSGAGVLIKESKKSDFTESPLWGQGFHTDGVLISNRTFADTYPYTIEIRFKSHNKQTLNIGHWMPVQKPRVAVQNASLTIKAPDSSFFRYKNLNLTADCSRSQVNGKQVFKWEINHFQAIEEQAFFPYDESVYPMVLLGANNFYCDGTYGNMQSWETFGYWSYGLIKDRATLPPATVTKMNELCKNAPNDREKIKRIYKYMQSNTRYVNIAEGIGGWQPFTAEFVDNTNYGDCKALSNYTRALLKAVGIESFYTRILSESDYSGMLVDFPSQQFNHIILCVPNQGDTIWLECTDQTSPFGFLGSSTNNRFALAITENGGKLVHTPNYDYTTNTYLGIHNATLDETGTLTVNSNIKSKALQYDQIAKLYYIKPDEQKEYLHEILDIPGLTINKFTTALTDEQLPVSTITVEATAGKYGSITANRLMFQLNIFNRTSYVPPKQPNRSLPLVLRSSFTDCDSVSFTIPDSYTVEYLPAPVKIESPYGVYQSQASLNGNTILYVRHLTRIPGQFPASEYEKVRTFYKSLASADNEKTVLIKR